MNFTVCKLKHFQKHETVFSLRNCSLKIEGDFLVNFYFNSPQKFVAQPHAYASCSVSRAKGTPESNSVHFHHFINKD